MYALSPYARDATLAIIYRSRLLALLLHQEPYVVYSHVMDVRAWTDWGSCRAAIEASMHAGVAPRSKVLHHTIALQDYY